MTHTDVISFRETLALQWYDLSQQVKGAVEMGANPVYVSLEKNVGHRSEEYFCNVWLNDKKGEPMFRNIVASGLFDEKVIARREVTEQLGIRLVDFYGIETYLSGRVVLPGKGPVMMCNAPLDKCLLERLLPPKGSKFDVRLVRF